MSRSHVWVALALCIASTYRAQTYLSTGTIVSPDSFSYLNAARQMRGDPIPGGWDPVAMMPGDDQGARPPVYPMFLNSVFALHQSGGTPARWLQPLQDSQLVDGWHWQFLATRENIRDVQFAQHLLGIIATWLVYLVVCAWTGRSWLAAATALVAVGVRPAWVQLFEPWVLSEVLAATLLLVWLWTIVRTLSPSVHRSVNVVVMTSILTAIIVLARPAFSFLPVLFLAYIFWTQPRVMRVGVAAILPMMLVLAGWVVRNESAYGFWGISSTLGINTISHFRGQPEAVDDQRVRLLIDKYRDEKYAGAWTAMDLVTQHELTYPQASALLVRESLHAALNHPSRFLYSYGIGVKEALLPIEWSMRGVISSFGAVFYLLLQLAVFPAIVISIPSLRLAACTAVASLMTMPLVTAIDNSRYSFPVTTLMLMTGAVTIQAAIAVRWSRRFVRI